jgi:hypothetical protein
MGKSVRYSDRKTGHALGEPVVEGALKRVGWSTVIILEVLNSNLNHTKYVEFWRSSEFELFMYIHANGK